MYTQCVVHCNPSGISREFYIYKGRPVRVWTSRMVRVSSSQSHYQLSTRNYSASILVPWQCTPHVSQSFSSVHSAYVRPPSTVLRLWINAQRLVLRCQSKSIETGLKFMKNQNLRSLQTHLPKTTIKIGLLFTFLFHF